jgi:hypothetical protein
MARKPEKVAGAVLASVSADDLFLNFLLLFVSRQKVRKLKRPKNILYFSQMIVETDTRH